MLAQLLASTVVPAAAAFQGHSRAPVARALLLTTVERLRFVRNVVWAGRGLTRKGAGLHLPSTRRTIRAGEGSMGRALSGMLSAGGRAFRRTGGSQLQLASLSGVD